MKITEKIKLTCEDIGISIRELDKKTMGGKGLLQNRVHTESPFSAAELKNIKAEIGDFEKNLPTVLKHREILANLDFRKLRNYRESQNLSISAAAAAVGIGRATYQAYESGTRKLTWPTFTKICDAMFLKPDDVVKESYKPKTKTIKQRTKSTVYMTWQKNRSGSYGEVSYVKK